MFGFFQFCEFKERTLFMLSYYTSVKLTDSQELHILPIN